ncbi:MAG TPA: cytochrome c oxidase subunit 3 family protein, partial [Planctomycetota bacterium]|nr:cytochrome c oxidase subunit 3 family protein [Planctomycetota bacterium]
HFDTSEQEFQAAKLGFWLFLATEILLFGGLFAAYFYFHENYPETFKRGGAQLNWILGALNTTVLLISSWTMAMGVRSAQTSQKRKMLLYLGLTALGAVTFLVVKFFEYKAKYDHGLMPGRFFTDEHGLMGDVPFAPQFFSIYFTATGLHGLHVLVGLCLILWIIKGGARGRFHANYYLPVDLVGLYWHLVDLIWIFLFPLLYLVP